jgi:hypothetical protein
MNLLSFMRYPALVCLATFWVIAALDFVCSLGDGNNAVGTFLDHVGIARFGLFGGAALGLGVCFSALYFLRDYHIARAAYKTALLAFGSTGIFELGIRLTDYSEFNLHVVALQIIPALSWTGFFTNSFLFSLSLAALGFLAMAALTRPSLIGMTLNRKRGGDKNG